MKENGFVRVRFKIEKNKLIKLIIYSKTITSDFRSYDQKFIQDLFSSVWIINNNRLFHIARSNRMNFAHIKTFSIKWHY